MIDLTLMITEEADNPVLPNNETVASEQGPEEPCAVVSSGGITDMAGDTVKMKGGDSTLTVCDCSEITASANTVVISDSLVTRKNSSGAHNESNLYEIRDKEESSRHTSRAHTVDKCATAEYPSSCSLISSNCANSTDCVAYNTVPNNSPSSHTISGIVTPITTIPPNSNLCDKHNHNCVSLMSDDTHSKQNLNSSNDRDTNCLAANDMDVVGSISGRNHYSTSLNMSQQKQCKSIGNNISHTHQESFDTITLQQENMCTNNFTTDINTSRPSQQHNRTTCSQHLPISLKARPNMSLHQNHNFGDKNFNPLCEIHGVQSSLRPSASSVSSNFHHLPSNAMPSNWHPIFSTVGWANQQQQWTNNTGPATSTVPDHDRSIEGALTPVPHCSDSRTNSGVFSDARTNNGVCSDARSVNSVCSDARTVNGACSDARTNNGVCSDARSVNSVCSDARTVNGACNHSDGTTTYNFLGVPINMTQEEFIDVANEIDHSRSYDSTMRKCNSLLHHGSSDTCHRESTNTECALHSRSENNNNSSDQVSCFRSSYHDGQASHSPLSNSLACGHKNRNSSSGASNSSSSLFSYKAVPQSSTSYKKVNSSSQLCNSKSQFLIQHTKASTSTEEKDCSVATAKCTTRAPIGRPTSAPSGAAAESISTSCLATTGDDASSSSNNNNSSGGTESLLSAVAGCGHWCSTCQAGVTLATTASDNTFSAGHKKFSSAPIPPASAAGKETFKQLPPSVDNTRGIESRVCQRTLLAEANDCIHGNINNGPSSKLNGGGYSDSCSFKKLDGALAAPPAAGGGDGGILYGNDGGGSCGLGMGGGSEGRGGGLLSTTTTIRTQGGGGGSGGVRTNDNRDLREPPPGWATPLLSISRSVDDNNSGVAGGDSGDTSLSKSLGASGGAEVITSGSSPSSSSHYFTLADTTSRESRRSSIKNKMVQKLSRHRQKTPSKDISNNNKKKKSSFPFWMTCISLTNKAITLPNTNKFSWSGSSNAITPTRPSKDSNRGIIPSPSSNNDTSTTTTAIAAIDPIPDLVASTGATNTKDTTLPTTITTTTTTPPDLREPPALLPAVKNTNTNATSLCRCQCTGGNNHNQPHHHQGSHSSDHQPFIEENIVGSSGISIPQPITLTGPCSSLSGGRRRHLHPPVWEDEQSGPLLYHKDECELASVVLNDNGGINFIDTSNISTVGTSRPHHQNSVVYHTTTEAVPLPWAYNSVWELQMLLERSLRLGWCGPSVFSQETIAQRLDRMQGICGGGRGTAALEESRNNGMLSGSHRTVHTQVDYIHCLVPDLLAITNCSFYWGRMDRYEAEGLLANRPEGTFLLRDSAQDEYLFSVSFRRYGKSLHARIEQSSHKFSFDSHDSGVFTSETVCGLIEHYKDPSCCMFFEPMLTNPLCRSFPFPLQHLCRAAICSSSTYDGINKLVIPKMLRNYLKEYHYKQLVRVRTLDH